MVGGLWRASTRAPSHVKTPWEVEVPLPGSGLRQAGEAHVAMHLQGELVVREIRATILALIVVFPSCTAVSSRTPFPEPMGSGAVRGI